VRDRNRKLQELMAELADVATQVGALNTAMAGHRDNGDPTQPPTAEAARDISATLLALSERESQRRSHKLCSTPRDFPPAATSVITSSGSSTMVIVTREDRAK
jgi:hypothetical protein